MLELSWLREQLANRGDSPNSDDEILRKWERAIDFHIGRRDLFKLAVTTSTLAPLATLAMQRSELVVERSGQSVSIYSASGRRWTIDPDRFDGKPCVTLEQHNKAFEISLVNAMLPGTSLRCDFRLTGKQRNGSWSGDFEFCEWGGVSTVSLDDWIDGSLDVLARIHLPSSEAGCPGFSVRLDGDATLSFSSDWSFAFMGDRIAQVLVNDNASDCSAITFEIPPADARSLLKDSSQRRSRAVFSGPGMASLRPDVGRASVVCSAELQLQAEFVRTRNDRILVASLWSTDAVDAGLTISVDEDRTEKIDLPIDSYRVVQLHDGERSNAALFAGVKSGEYWTDAGDASVAIVAQPGAMISATSHVSDSETCTCESVNTRLTRFVIPFIGADSACFTKRPAQGERIAESVEFKDHFSFFRGVPIDLDSYSLRVSRTTDSFVAIFRFRNIQLQSIRGRWYLCRKASCDGDSIVEFELPSQHLNEEAVFSASRPGLSNTKNEVLCGPFNSEQAKFVAFVGMYAFDAWKNPGEKQIYADIRALLIKFIVELRKKEPPEPRPVLLLSIDLNGSELPSGFGKYLTQEYGGLLVTTARENPNPVYGAILREAKNEKALYDDIATWKPLAIDAGSTRLLFKAVFAKDAEVPCHLETLMAWSSADSATNLAGLRFEELLSERAVPANTPLDKQKQLNAQIGAPIFGLHETNWAKSAKEPRVGDSVPDISTALEMPYRLVVTPIRRDPSSEPPPDNKPFWQSLDIPRSIWGSTVPLWHVRGGRSGGAPIAMRALYSPDFRKGKVFQPPPPNESKMRTSLDAHDRHNLVGLTSGFGEPALLGMESVVKDKYATRDKGIFVPQPFHARQLVLTSLGASFDFLGTWDPPAAENGGALTVSKWDHRARIRRDTEVTVEYRGYLLPLGVPAIFIKKTTREFKRVGNSNNESYRAVLIQRYYIRVDQKTKEFPALYQSFASRDWCFRNIKVTPEETPPLLPPEGLIDSEIDSFGRQAFWPMIPPNPQARSCSTGKLLEFTVEAGECAFNVPLVFVDNQVVHTPSSLKIVLGEYAKHVALRKWDLATRPSEEFGVEKALARMVKGDVEYLPGASSRNSRHVTRWFALGFQLSGQKTVLPDRDEPLADDEELLKFDEERERRRQPPFYPRVSQALIESKLLAQLSGNSVARNNISYHPIFVAKGFDETKNVGGVFVRFVQQGAPMVFGKNTTASGGVMCPTTTMVAIAREHGPIGGDAKSVFTLSQPTAGKTLVAKSAAGGDDPVAKFMEGTSDPVEYFAGALGDAKLLGCVRLVDIIKAVLQVTDTRVPRINQKEIFDGVIDSLKPVLLNVADGPVNALRELEAKLADSSKTPPAVSARLLPPLRAAIASLEQVQAELQKASPKPDVVAGLVGSAYSSLQKFAGDARQLTENPIALLPPSVAEKIEDVRKLYDQLVAIREAVEELPKALRELLIEALAAETQALQDAAQATPEYRATIAWVARIKAQLEALAQAIADSAWQRIGQALQTMVEPVAELRSWLEINGDRLKEAVIEFAKPVRAAVKEAAKEASGALDLLKKFQTASSEVYNAAVQANKTEAAAKILEVMRSTHQVREVLVAFIDFAKRVDQANQDPMLDALSMALEYLQKTETLLRKAGEIIKLAKECASLSSGPGNRSLLMAGTESLETPINEMQKQLDGFCDSIFRVVTDLGLSTSLQDLRTWLGMALPAGGLKTSIDAALEDAIKDAKRLEKSPGELKVVLETQKAALFERIESYLSLLLARVAPKAAAIVAATERWRTRFVEAQQQLHDALKDTVLDPCAKLSAWNPPDKNLPLAKGLLKRLSDLKVGELSTVCGDASQSPEKVLDAIRAASMLADEVFELVGYVGEAVHGGNLDALVDQRAVVESVLQAIGIPTKLRITYDWDTDIEDFPQGGGAIFRPDRKEGTGAGKHPRLAIHSVTEMDLRNPKFPSTTVKGSIDAFDLYLFGSAPFLIVKLYPVTFISGSQQPMKFDVRVKEVKFGAALNFVNDLAQYIGAESGFYLQAADGFPGIEIGYRFNKDIIQLAALTLQNVSLSLAVILPFDNTPMRLKVAVGSRQKPVLASVGIYGAGFFVAMTLRADAMELMEFSLEYGGITGLRFGGDLATGTCKVTAGVYIALGVRDEISGFFSAVGALSIANLIKIGAALVVSISKEKDKMTGSAIFTFSFSIAFIDYSYSVAVSYTKDGDKDMRTDAEDKALAEDDVKSSASSQPRITSAQNSAAVYNAMDHDATHPADFRVDMNETRAAPDSPPQLHAGLAESSVWQAYWNAFSDLGDAQIELCPIPRS